jgi:catalase
VIREKMVSHFTQADAEYGRRVAEGLGMAAPSKQAAE